MINVNVIYLFILGAIRINNVNPLVLICIGCEYAYICCMRIVCVDAGAYTVYMHIVCVDAATYNVYASCS